MRYISLNELFAAVFADAAGRRIRRRLINAHNRLARMDPMLRHDHIRRNGTNKWSPLKDRLTAILANKCWYTEAELIGAHLAIDHYRPVYDYWWLAYDVENYRVACPFANSPEHNREHGCAGGKGDNFPLLPPGQRAGERAALRLENPVILDPCNEQDCALLVFQADGRPIVNPTKVSDLIAAERVEKSKILLNLDHPDFNSTREQLCRDIADEVKAYEQLPVTAESRLVLRNRLERRISPNAPFSTAARYYLKLHRHLDWVENLLNTQ
jgi:hypothetical protein